MPIRMSPETDYRPSMMHEDYIDAVIQTNRVDARGDTKAGTTLEHPLSERPLLYIAGFYSANPAHGLANAVHWFDPAISAGWLPLIPHTTFLVDMISPRPPGFWYEYDKGLLLSCSAMFVCPDHQTRKSMGVRDEISFAHTHDIPIMRDVMLSPEEMLR